MTPLHDAQLQSRLVALSAALAAAGALVLALAACGSTAVGPSSGRPATPTATLSAHTSSGPAAAGVSSSPAFHSARTSTRPSAHISRSRIDTTVAVAQATYRNETQGGKLFEQLGRIARDSTLLNALARGNLGAAQAEANAQLRSPLNHYVHVTRIAVIRGGRMVVNATVNYNGAFVVAPATRALRLHGRPLGTLLVSIQDVVGYAKLVHNLTLAQVLVRGSSGQVRTSPGATAHLPLPASGAVQVAGRRYLVRSFGETAWGGERLTVWVLEAG